MVSLSIASLLRSSVTPLPLLQAPLWPEACNRCRRTQQAALPVVRLAVSSGIALVAGPQLCVSSLSL